MFRVSSKTHFENIEKLLKRNRVNPLPILKRYAERGLEALMLATPKDTGKTANSWYYDIYKKGDTYTISWNNSNIERGMQIAVLIQLGHATKNGGFVEGIDYINPALQKVFKDLASNIGKELDQ